MKDGCRADVRERRESTGERDERRGRARRARGEKGLAQKYLDALAERGKIAFRDAGKQKVYHALQDGEVLDATRCERCDRGREW